MSILYTITVRDQTPKERKSDKKYEFQLKSSTVFSKNKNKDLKIRDVRYDHLEYWCKRLNFPAFIFAVEVSTKKIYWVDPRPYYQQIKLKKQKTISVLANPNNEFTLKNKQKFLTFLLELNADTARRNLSKTENIILSAANKGYSVLQEENGFSFSPSEKSKDFPAQITANMNVSIEQIIKGGEFDANDVRLMLGNEVIDNLEKAKIIIGATKKDIRIELSILHKSYLLNAEINTRKNNIVILNTKTQEILNFKIESNLSTGENNFLLNINIPKISSLQEYIDIIEFMNNIHNGLDIAFFDENGSRKNIFSLDSERLKDLENIDDDLFIKFLKDLKRIEEIYNVQFNVQEIQKIEDKDFPCLSCLAKVLLNERVELPASISVKVEVDENKELSMKNHYSRIELEEISFLGNTIKPRDKVLIFEGQSKVESERKIKKITILTSTVFLEEKNISSPT